MIRYPAPQRPGDRIGVTAPSAGVAERHRLRLEFCVRHLREVGYYVVVGDCLDGSAIVSAPPVTRAAELMAMLTDPTVRAVVPPWGGRSDLSTLLLPLTCRTGVASLHGPNLMDTPYRLPPEIRPWLEVVPGATPVTQAASRRHRLLAAGFDRWEDGAEVVDYTLDEDGSELTSTAAASTWAAASSAAAWRPSRNWPGRPTATLARSRANTHWRPMTALAHNYGPSGGCGRVAEVDSRRSRVDLMVMR